MTYDSNYQSPKELFRLQDSHYRDISDVALCLCLFFAKVVNTLYAVKRLNTIWFRFVCVGRSICAESPEKRRKHCIIFQSYRHDDILCSLQSSTESP